MSLSAPEGAPHGLLTACAYAEAILVAVLLALFARAYLFEAFEIPSGSMERTLLVGDHIVVDKAAYAPHRGPWRFLLPYREVSPGDVVVFRSPEEPGKDLIKRAIGLPDDTIRLTGDREVMGDNVDSPALRVAGWTSAFLIVTLNVALLALTLGVGR